MTTIVNGRLLGQGNNALTMMGNATFSFNGYNLANGTTVKVIACNSDDLGNVDLERFNYAQQDGGGVYGRYFRSHTINITLSINEATHEKMLALMDEIKFQCSALQAPLRIKSGEIVREWTATCTAIKFNRESYSINVLPKVQLTFIAQNPHSHALKPISKDITGQVGNYKSSISYIGRASSFLTMNMLIEESGTYALSFKLNGFTISLASRTYTAGDIVKLDGVTKEATINDVEVEYVGSFRPLNYGDNPIEINFAGTYTATLSYYENYL